MLITSIFCLFFYGTTKNKVLYLETVFLYINRINWLNIGVEMIVEEIVCRIFVRIDVILLHIISSF